MSYIGNPLNSKIIKQINSPTILSKKLVTNKIQTGCFMIIATNIEETYTPEK